MRPARFTSAAPSMLALRAPRPSKHPRTPKRPVRRLEKSSYQKKFSTLPPRLTIFCPRVLPQSGLPSLNSHYSVRSLSLLTRSASTTRPPFGKNWNPAATPAQIPRVATGTSPAYNPRRNTSEITLPTDRPDRAASSLAASTTSSSRFSVVLIPVMLLRPLRWTRPAASLLGLKPRIPPFP